MNGSLPVLNSLYELPLRLLDAWCGARALVAAFGRAVRNDRGLVEEFQSGVRLGDAGQPLRRVVHVELEDREKALQVGLLVDRELDVPGGEQLLGDRRQVIPAADPSLGFQTLLLDRLGDALGAARVNGEHALGARMRLGP